MKQMKSKLNIKKWENIPTEKKKMQAKVETKEIQQKEHRLQTKQYLQ
jgi:hypothetical protein